MCVHLSCGDSTFTYTGLDLNILYYCTMLLMSHIPLAPIWATAICLISRNALAFSSQRTMTSPRGPLSPSLDNLKKKHGGASICVPAGCDACLTYFIQFHSTLTQTECDTRDTKSDEGNQMMLMKQRGLESVMISCHQRRLFPVSKGRKLTHH